MCLQDLSEDLDFQEEKAQGVVRELDLISSVASPEALEPLTQDAYRLKHAFSLGRELIQRRRDDQGKDLATAIRGPLYPDSSHSLFTLSPYSLFTLTPHTHSSYSLFILTVYTQSLHSLFTHIPYIHSVNSLFNNHS